MPPPRSAAVLSPTMPMAIRSAMTATGRAQGLPAASPGMARTGRLPSPATAMWPPSAMVRTASGRPRPSSAIQGGNCGDSGFNCHGDPDVVDEPLTAFLRPRTKPPHEHHSRSRTAQRRGGLRPPGPGGVARKQAPSGAFFIAWTAKWCLTEMEIVQGVCDGHD